MMENFCEKLDDPKFDVTKQERINQVWDQRILHVANQTINGEGILLVTSDKEMTKAVTETGKVPDSLMSPGNVVKLSDYLSWLESL